MTQKALTVGEVREALAKWPDDQKLRIMVEPGTMEGIHQVFECVGRVVLMSYPRSRRLFHHHR